MVNVAKATRRLQPEPLDPRILGILDQMQGQATVQLELALDAFAQRDPAQGSDLPEMDDVMDDLTRQLFRTIFGMDRYARVGVRNALARVAQRCLTAV